jgi:parallel beta-helix repeat protein
MSAKWRILLRNSAFITVFLLPLVVAAQAAFAVGPAIIAVTTTNDVVDGAVSSLTALSGNAGPDGRVSLREAMLAAEATPPGETLRITFNLPLNDPGYETASGTWRIHLVYSPSARLPDLARGSISIDASTQPHSTTSPAVIIDGFDVVEGPGESNGFVIRSATNTLRGLALINFYDSAVLLAGTQATGNTIAACSIGVSARGEVELPGYIGVEVRDGAAGNMVGGNIAADGNQITANLNAGILVNGADTHSNRIRHNLIGPTVGSVSTGNQYGIALLDETAENQIADNTISGNNFGLYIRDATQNQITGNIVGLSTDGQAPQPNTQGGIYLVDGATSNTIGGATPAERNIISGNGGAGVYIANTGSDENVVLGNYIGLAADGLTPRGNLRQGILIAFNAARNQIGGSTGSEGNVIVYNGLGGIRVDSNLNSVIGNLIGLAPDLTTPLGNQFHGIRVNGTQNQVNANTLAYNQGSGLVVGGNENSIDENRIRDNAYAGVCIAGNLATVTNNVISGNGYTGNPTEECIVNGGVIITGNNTNVSGNAIFSNAGAGIMVMEGDSNTLSSNSITNNTEGISLKDGGNGAIDPPQITLVTRRLIGGTACGSCTVEVFVDSGSQGRDLLGQVQSQTDGAFQLSLSTPLPTGNITATLTDAAGNTSGFTVVPGLPARTSENVALPFIQVPSE